jgi:biotin-dependent carboxylase-like uncharacterized protein
VRTLTLDRAGIASTIQDSGRLGTLHAGIAAAGAMDPLALKAGQHCLGHHAGEAAIEIAYGNVSATPSHDCALVVTGAPAMLLIDNESVPMRSVHTLSAGQTLTIGPPSEGIYSYLHVSGGFTTRPIFNSRSTSPREGIGGLHGGYLRDQDAVPIGDGAAPIDTYRADPGLCSIEQRALLTLRYVPGYQYDELAPELIQRLNGDHFEVTSKANRMGITLIGPPLKTGVESLLSEATCQGAIQIPPDGNPIVLMKDRQTMGGYPIPGAVIESDCVRLAQARPGQTIRFVACTPQEADNIRWLEQHYVETRLR